MTPQELKQYLDMQNEELHILINSHMYNSARMVLNEVLEELEKDWTERGFEI